MLDPKTTPLILLTDGYLGQYSAKTAHGVLHHGQWPISAIFDRAASNADIAKLLPNHTHRPPIVQTLNEAMTCDPTPKALLIGIAPPGGQLPPNYRALIKDALQQGLHIISGLHQFLSDDPELTQLAQNHNVTLWDVRRVPDSANVIAKNTPRPLSSQVITMVGSDCSVGKMYTALALRNAFKSANECVEFIPTGQTGIMIEGWGLPLDRVIGDFMAGATESLINERLNPKVPQQWLFVEGQGSLLHPAYSSVTLGLLHGSAPDGLILCHDVSRVHIKNYPHLPIPSFQKLITMYETACGWIKPARVMGISLNTSSVHDEKAQSIINTLQQETGLAVCDPMRTGVQPLVDALKRSVPCH